MARYAKTSPSQNTRIGAKISHLVREGKPQKQAVAIAHSMARAGRLGPHGEYRRKKR